MKRGRLILGGLVAGLIINVVEGVTNGAILGDQWKEWASRTAAILQQPSQAAGMVIWTVLAFAIGLAGLWLYAAIRPRYGPGPRTALYAALFLWLTFWVFTALQSLALGTIPHRFLAIGLIGGLVAAVAGMLAGCAIYRET